MTMKKIMLSKNNLVKEGNEEIPKAKKPKLPRKNIHLAKNHFRNSQEERKIEAWTSNVTANLVVEEMTKRKKILMFGLLLQVHQNMSKNKGNLIRVNLSQEKGR